MIIRLTADQRAALDTARRDYEYYADAAWRAKQRGERAIGGLLTKARTFDFVVNSIARPYGPDDVVEEV